LVFQRGLRAEEALLIVPCDLVPEASLAVVEALARREPQAFP
jgi:hypothetical protein